MMERYSIVYNVTSNIINSFNSSDKCLFTKSEKTLIRRVKDCIIIFPFGKTLIVHVPSGYERSFPFENELFSRCSVLSEHILLFIEVFLWQDSGTDSPTLIIQDLQKIYSFGIMN